MAQLWMPRHLRQRAADLTDEIQPRQPGEYPYRAADADGKEQREGGVMTIATKVDAVVELMRECQRNKCSDTAAKRVVKACRLLGIQGDEMIRVLQWIGYCQSDGTPYGKIKRIW